MNEYNDKFCFIDVNIQQSAGRERTRDFGAMNESQE